MSTKPEYSVTFTFTYFVTAEDESDAENAAWEMFNYDAPIPCKEFTTIVDEMTHA